MCVCQHLKRWTVCSTPNGPNQRNLRKVYSPPESLWWITATGELDGIGPEGFIRPGWVLRHVLVGMWSELLVRRDWLRVDINRLNCSLITERSDGEIRINLSMAWCRSARGMSALRVIAPLAA